MGYTTEFSGKVTISPALSLEDYKYLEALSQNDQRDKGPWQVPGKAEAGHYFCQWSPSEDGTSLAWDGNEKFYHSAGWMRYIVEDYLAPMGYVCNGEIEAQGEDMSDRWLLRVQDNVARKHEGKLSYD